MGACLDPHIQRRAPVRALATKAASASSCMVPNRTMATTGLILPGSSTDSGRPWDYTSRFTRRYASLRPPSCTATFCDGHCTSESKNRTVGQYCLALYLHGLCLSMIPGNATLRAAVHAIPIYTKHTSQIAHCRSSECDYSASSTFLRIRFLSMHFRS